VLERPLAAARLFGSGRGDPRERIVGSSRAPADASAEFSEIFAIPPNSARHKAGSTASNSSRRAGRKFQPRVSRSCGSGS